MDNRLQVSIDKLDLILEKHPYFQLGMMEKTKRLRLENHIDSIKNTRKCAIALPDRSLLFQYFQDKKEADKVHQAKEAIEVAAEEVEAAIEELITDDVLKEERVSEAIPEESAAVIESPLKIIPKEDEILEEKEDVEIGLSKDYLAEAINQSIQVEASYYDLNELVEEKGLKAEREENPGILSFSDWLSGESDKDVKRDKDALIDKFIQENPQISRLNTQSFYSPIEKGKESISEKNVPYTETLARIFVLQGNKSLAIKAYKYLMLKNPQKSVYFADLIKKLEE
jgi:hypothetical protein